MKKSFTLATVLFSVLFFSPPVLWASGGHHGHHYDRGHGWGHYKGHGHGWGHFKKHHHPRYYAPPRHYYRPVRDRYWAPPARYYGYRNHHHHRHDSNYGILGGALGGTLGGIAGHEFSGGNPVATGVGAAAGAIIGYEIVD